jgi:para-nitrobenzyl esterase
MPMTVSTTQGDVRGQEDGGVTRFLGIPYAASPTGDLQFRAPVPPLAWDGVLDAHAFSATCPSPTIRRPST